MGPLQTLGIVVFFLAIGFFMMQGNCVECVFIDNCDCDCPYDFYCKTLWDMNQCSFVCTDWVNTQQYPTNDCLTEGETIPSAPECGCQRSRSFGKVSYKCGFQEMNDEQKCFVDCSSLRDPVSFQTSKRFLKLSPVSFSCKDSECIGHFEFEGSTFKYFSDSSLRGLNTCDFWQIFDCDGSLCDEFTSVYHLTIDAENYSEISCPDYSAVIDGRRIDQDCRTYINELKQPCSFRIY